MSNLKDSKDCLCTSCSSHPKFAENIFSMHEYSLSNDRCFISGEKSFSKHMPAKVKNKAKQQTACNKTGNEDKSFVQDINIVFNSTEIKVSAIDDSKKTIADLSSVKKNNSKTLSSTINLKNFEGQKFIRRPRKYPKRLNLASRSDVVNKCSIRKLRRHFWTLFRVNNK